VRTYSGTTILGNFVSQIFFDDTISNTVLAQSSYTRTTSRDTTNSNDMVYQTANKERMLSTITGNNTDGYTATITAGLTIAAPVATAPTITSGGVTNAVSGAAGVSAGAWTSIYGSGFATATRTLAASDLVDNTIPTTLGGVSVQIDGKAAFVQYVSANQVNVLAPADIGAGTVAVTVTNASGTSNSVTTTLQAVLPGLSTASNYVRAVRYPDGAVINGTGATETGYTTSAAVGQGDVIALYGTGFGPTSSTVTTGVVFTGAYATTNTVTVTIGGVPAEVLFAGLVGPGLYQINVRVPAALADGDQAVVATVAGLSSQSSALLKVAASAKLSSSVRGGVSILARMLGVRDAVNGLQPSGKFFGHQSVERLAWLTRIKAGGIKGGVDL
jgi:uncharacterized protein (TIGR03437 family)